MPPPRPDAGVQPLTTFNWDTYRHDRRDTVALLEEPGKMGFASTSSLYGGIDGVAAANSATALGARTHAGRWLGCSARCAWFPLPIAHRKRGRRAAQ